MKAKQKVPVRKLSTSVPGWMKPVIMARAAALDLTVSQYLRRLVNDEINVEELKVRDEKCRYYSV
jgi:hypothetical protein